MFFTKNRSLLPSSIRLEASTVCQLKCPSCPNAMGEIAQHLGRGFLKLADFQTLIDRNPWVARVELSNWGEVFLNPELPAIMEYAHQNQVALSAGNGANLNTASEEALEALVKYQFRALTCSLDGASAESYPLYRVNGDFNRVLDNLRTINRHKAARQSPFPALKWQFVVFGHNEHEIGQARRMAVDLNMDFVLKLPWENLYGQSFSPIKDAELVRREAGVGAATRQEYRRKHGKEYSLRWCCCHLWKAPQINFDGRVLGCPINYVGDYGNAFRDGLTECLNSERIRQARQMLMGLLPPQDGIPCTTCPSYLSMRENRAWLTPDEIRLEAVRSRATVLLENRTPVGATFTPAPPPPPFWQGARTRITRTVRRLLAPTNRRLTNRLAPLHLPLPPDEEKGWKPHGLFRGTTGGRGELACHASVLTRNRCPHLPHTHEEEELLLVLRGETDVVFPNPQAPYGNRRAPLRAGQFIFYPAGVLHTLQATGDTPVNYLMFKWRGPGKPEEHPLARGPFEMAGDWEPGVTPAGFQSRIIFEWPTAFLKKLHCHASRLAPGAGYAPHSDPYDVAILVLEGELETLGQRTGPHGVIFYAAGEPHGLRNPGTTLTRYVVFEFHW